MTFFLATQAVNAHELWIEPTEFEAELGASVNAALVNGENFEGISLAYATRSIVRLEWKSPGISKNVEGRLGNRPAISIPSADEGLLAIGYQSIAQRLAYSEWEKFESFATGKGYFDAATFHDSLGISREKFDEGYTRFSKSLIAVGNGNGEDQPFGFEAELVALKNPYTADIEDNIEILLLYQGVPRPSSQVEIFERSPEGQVVVTKVQTNERGVASITVRKGHDYMLDSVIFRAPSDELLERMNVDWETLWANLTFSIPH